MTGRHRRTKAELAAVDEAIIRAVAEDHPVTLRGVFYRVVSAGAIEKSDSGYNVIQRQLLKLRRGNAVSYRDIVDGTRPTWRPNSWSSAEEAVEAAGRSYRQALWEDQDSEVMIVTEKDAISGVVMPVTREWDVPLTVLRGYSSETAAWGLAQDVMQIQEVESRVVYLYQLGDHDPSGVDAWRSFAERITEFCEEEYSSPPTFERLAVTSQQIRDMSLPTRPTKMTDTRAPKFVGESVEVDAIRASVLRQIVRDSIEQHIDQERLAITRQTEQAEKEILQSLLELAGPSG